MRFFACSAGYPHCVLADGTYWKWPVASGELFVSLCRKAVHAVDPSLRLSPSDIRSTWVPVPNPPHHYE